MTDTKDNARQEAARGNSKPAENQKHKPAPQNEPVDPLDTGCGFMNALFSARLDYSSAESWLGKIGQVDKWSFCLKAA